MLQDDARPGLDLLVWTGDEGHLVHLDEEDFQRDLSEVVTEVLNMVSMKLTLV
jgi:hypothetical protein